MAASEAEDGVQMRGSQSFRARVQFRKSCSGPPKMEGYLRKRTAKLNLKWFWRKYWFVLDGRSLLYFKSQSNYNNLGTCKGLVDFGLVQAVRPSHGSKNTYAIEVITRSDVIHLAADDWQTRQVWVAALQAAIQISEVSWPFKVQDNAPTLVQMQRGDMCNSPSTNKSEGQRSRSAERSHKTSSLIIYENVSFENVALNGESSGRRPSSEGAVYQQISEANQTAHDSEAVPPTEKVNAFSKGSPCAHTKKDKAYGMLRRARSFSFGLMVHKGRLPGFHRNRVKSSKSGSKDATSRKHDSSPSQTPDSNRASRETKTASHQKEDSIGSVPATELAPKQSGCSSKNSSHQKQGSTGSAKLRVDATPKVRSRLDSSSSNRVDEHRITAILDLNPTYQTAGELRTDLPGEPARKRQDSESRETFVPDFSSRPQPSPMPRGDVAMMSNQEYAEVYEGHMPPQLMPKTGGEHRADNHSTSLRNDQIDAMIANREYAEVYEDHFLPSSLQRPEAHADHNGSNSQGHMQAPGSEYAEIIEGNNTLPLVRTFSSPPGCSGSGPPDRRLSDPESSYTRKMSKDSADDSSLHIYQEVRGSSGPPSPQPSPRTIFMPSSTRFADMDDEEESYYSSISEEDLRRYQWSSDLARVGETSETGTESSTYNTADASGSSEALAETGYMEDNPHITVVATDSEGRAASNGRLGVAPPSEAMRELRELLDCLGTEDGGNMLTGQRSITRARQLLVREMSASVNEA